MFSVVILNFDYIANHSSTTYQNGYQPEFLDEGYWQLVKTDQERIKLVPLFHVPVVRMSSGRFHAKR